MSDVSALCTLKAFSDPLGLHEAWCDGVDANAIRAERDGQGLTQCKQRGFTRPVRRVVRFPTKCAPRPDVDDVSTATRAHHGVGSAVTNIGGGEEIDIYGLFPRALPFLIRGPSPADAATSPPHC